MAGGYEVVCGIATCRATGTWWVSRLGRRRPPSGFSVGVGVAAMAA